MYFTSILFEILLACQQDKIESFFNEILLKNADKIKLKLCRLILVFKLFTHKELKQKIYVGIEYLNVFFFQIKKWVLFKTLILENYKEAKTLEMPFLKFGI